MRQIRHDPIAQHVPVINQMLRGHDAYDGMAGNMRALVQVYQATETYWRRMLSSRSQKRDVSWTEFQQIKARFPLNASKAVHSLSGIATRRDSVKPRLKSLVREIRTPGSVGVGLPDGSPSTRRRRTRGHTIHGPTPRLLSTYYLATAPITSIERQNIVAKESWEYIFGYLPSGAVSL